MEEERRLMYVAITRAEKALFLTESEGYNYATKSAKYPSRFISEIGEDLIRLEGYIDPTLIAGCKNLVEQLCQEIEGNDIEFEEGEIVQHEIFGEGTILSINIERKSCEVQFGKKTRNIQWNFLKKGIW